VDPSGELTDSAQPPTSLLGLFSGLKSLSQFSLILETDVDCTSLTVKNSFLIFVLLAKKKKPS